MLLNLNTNITQKNILYLSKKQSTAIATKPAYSENQQNSMAKLSQAYKSYGKQQINFGSNPEYKFTETTLPGVIIVKPKFFPDSRGFFQETYRKSVFAANGITDNFVQDNHSKSTKGVLRGLRLHDDQAKLVKCTEGEIFDVAVDMRKDSPNYKKWFGTKLNEDNKNMLYIPKGFAHGFVVLSDEADVMYKLSSEHNNKLESSIRWDDPDIGIEWPIEGKPILSKNDKEAPFLKDTEE